MDFAPTKIRPGDIKKCLKCRLNYKVDYIGQVNEELEESDKEIQLKISPLITIGVEIESYLIKERKIINGESVTPIEEVIEPGEVFTIDKSIGNEYNSPPFTNLNEGLFLIKAGLRKYSIFCEESGNYQIGLFGTWLEDPAGCHIHIGFGEEGIEKKDAIPLAKYIHDYLPFIIAICSNSPIYKNKMTKYASNRIKRYGKIHCKSIRKKDIRNKGDHWTEINYNATREAKPPTVEIRVFDSNIPEFIITAATVLKILTIAYVQKKPIINDLNYRKYQRSKWSAIKYGVRGSLFWNGRNIKFPIYIDKFFDSFHEEIAELDLTSKILDIFRLAKLGYNNAIITKEGLRYAKSVYRSKKFNWKKQFIYLYRNALKALLDGASIDVYARMLNVELPNISDLKLGNDFPI